MNKFRIQAQQQLEETIVTSALFKTPGGGSEGDVRPEAIFDRLVHLVFDDSSIPLTREEDKLNGYAGLVYVVATESEIIMFTVEQTFWSSRLSDILIRCNRQPRTSISYCGSIKITVEFSISETQCFKLEIAEARQNIASFVRHFDRPIDSAR